MKLFFASRIDLFKLELLIVNEAAQSIKLIGEQCSEMIPYLGINLDEGEEEKLKDFLNDE